MESKFAVVSLITLLFGTLMFGQISVVNGFTKSITRPLSSPVTGPIVSITPTATPTIKPSSTPTPTPRLTITPVPLKLYTISGNVYLDKKGKKMAGNRIKIQFIRPDSKKGSVVYTTYTNSKGSYTMYLPAAQYKVVPSDKQVVSFIPSTRSVKLTKNTANINFTGILKSK